MPKKDKDDVSKVQKEFKDFFRKLNRKQFNSDEEKEAFMKNMEGKSLSDFPEERTTIEKSQDMVYEAYELSEIKGRQLVKKALELDPNNADAFVYLGRKENDIPKAISLFTTAAELVEKKLGEELFKQYKGNFWGVFETRPYMEAKAGIADCLLGLGKTEEAIKIYQELMRLNQADNQGIRYILSTLYLENNKLRSFKELYRKLPKGASAAYNYNWALYHFKKNAYSEKAYKFLLKAYKQNVHVIDFLIGEKTIPKQLPSHIGFGDESEAIVYAANNWHIWRNTKDALQWIFDFRAERIQLN